MTILLMLIANVRAQQNYYICQGDSCDAFEANSLNPIVFTGEGYMQVGMHPAYPKVDVDSVVFLQVSELGWQGDGENGQLCYKAHQTITEDSLDCEIQYVIDIANSICQSATCSIFFQEEWMAESVISIINNSDTTDDPNIIDDPDPEGDYIYVKVTQTGPRKHEVWTMCNDVMVQGAQWNREGNVVKGDCSQQLSQRHVAEVVQIVEAWVYQKEQRISI